MVDREGYEADHVFALGMGEAEDTEIWKLALEVDSVIVTKDSDFAERRSRQMLGPRIVWLRVGNTSTPALLVKIADAWASIESELVAGVTIIEVR